MLGMLDKMTRGVCEGNRFLEKIIGQLLDGKDPIECQQRPPLMTPTRYARRQDTSEGTIGFIILNPQGHDGHRTV